MCAYLIGQIARYEALAASATGFFKQFYLTQLAQFQWAADVWNCF